MANGNINDAVSGNYILGIGEVFSEAWQKTNGFKGKALGAFVLLYVVLFLTMLGLMFVLGVESQAEQNPLTSLIIQLVIALIVYPMSAGIMMMGIHQVAGKPVKVGMIFGYFDKTLRIFGLYLLMTIMIAIGFVLLIIPGVYLAVAYTLALPLLIEKNMGIWEALETSRKALSKRWFTVFVIFVLLGLLFVAGTIPLGIGLIWVIPLSITVMGVMYKTIFGIS
ncbi:MAG TPA: hypothetical protein VGL10_04350 [Gammaproteobacteria bacterium]